MKFIIGKKLGMTQAYQGEEVAAVTKVQAGPCAVVQIKDRDKDGYQAVQLGFGEKQEKNIKKPQKGHMRGMSNFRFLREFRIEDSGAKRGDMIEAGMFKAGDRIQVSGISKGKGFQGVVRRHGFQGSKKTHGNKDQLRMPGSIGATGPAHVFKGTRMGGRMGGDNVTVKNLEIIEVKPEENLILVKGAVPGARNGLLLIAGDGELEISQPNEKAEGKTAEESHDGAKGEDGKKE